MAYLIGRFFNVDTEQTVNVHKKRSGVNDVYYFIYRGRHLPIQFYNGPWTSTERRRVRRLEDGSKQVLSPPVKKDGKVVVSLYNEALDEVGEMVFANVKDAFVFLRPLSIHYPRRSAAA